MMQIEFRRRRGVICEVIEKGIYLSLPCAFAALVGYVALVCHHVH
ncbi:MAG TPA: hypothetical protein VJL54_06565 [Nitrososphaera sp.]|nr:hypothetical protein [Nitrososphaera sp.]